MAKAVIGAAEIAGGIALMATGVGGPLGAMLLSSGITTEAGAIAEALGSKAGLATTTRSPASYRQIIRGEQRVPGVIVYASTTGSSKRQYNLVIVLATHPCEAIVNLYLDGRQVFWSSGSSYNQTVNGVNFGGNADGSDHYGPNGVKYNFGGKVFCAAFYGKQTSDPTVVNGAWVGPTTIDDTTASYPGFCSALQANDGTWSPTTNGTPYLAGCTYVYLKLEADSGTFPQFPEIRFTVRGKNDILDPRTNTRGYTTNWALHVADAITDPTWGLGDNTVNQDQLIAAANVCDEQVTCAAGQESRYTLHWHYDTSISPGDVIQRMMDSAAGRLSRIGGEWFIWPAYWQGPSFTFNADSLVDTVQWTPKRSLDSLFNRVTGTYIAANYPYSVAGNLYDSNGYYMGQTQNNFPYAFQPTNYPMYACDQLHGYGTGVDVYLTEDGGIYLPKEIDQPCVLSISQTQRVAKIMLLRNRQQGTGVLPMTLAAYQMQPTDVLQMNLSQLNWSNKVLEVVGTTLRYVKPQGSDTAGWMVEVQVQETDSSVYEWASTEELTPYDVPAMTGGVETYTVQPPTNITITDDANTAIVLADGKSQPRAHITWTEPNDTYVTNGGSIVVQYCMWGTTANSNTPITISGTTYYPTDWIGGGTYSGQTASCYIDYPHGYDMLSVRLQSVRSSGATSDWVEDSATAGGTPFVLPDAAPQQVTGVSATEIPYKTSDGTILSLVAVDFTPAANDPYFSSANIYFTGYTGNTSPQLMANAATSPAQFLCQTTQEAVTVTVVAVSGAGIEADFASAPTTTVALDGVQSAPPAPSISQAQVALNGNTGWQFAFNIIGGMEFDQIQSYRIYHSETNTAPTNYYRTIPQPNTNYGQEVVQEITGDILFYWVSAVNTAGLESVLTPVPFTYIDPGSPPPSLTSVTTTNVYSPTLSLNGWGANAHVGYWEPSDGTFVFGTQATAVNAFSNPGNAYDGNQSTAARWSMAHSAQYAGCVWSFSNFPGLASGATLTAATLSVVSDVMPTSGPVHGQGSVWYSTDNGSTWTSVYTAISVQRNKQTDTVTLATSINPTQLQVMAFAHSHDDLAMDVYEISLAITQTSNAGPEQVNGVTASLVSGNVQISWNALVPLSRTDIENYEVYRALHGAGYLNSHLQTTITPTGASTYSWTDTEAHDGSWDYWVIAKNSTGYSPASDTVTLHSSTNVLYTNGVTLESLKPAQAGADVTGLNTAADTSAVNGAAASVVAQGAIGINVNLIPDSDLRFGSTYWPTASPFSISQGTAPNGGNCLYFNGTANTGRKLCTTAIPVVAGQQYTLSAYLEGSGVTTGYVFFGVQDNLNNVHEVSLGQSNGRKTVTFTIPSGVTTLTPYYGTWAISGTATGTGNISTPMLQSGSVATAYVPNILDNGTGYLKAGAAQFDLSSNIHLNKTATYLLYSNGLTVESLRPAEAGADVTGSNTALNVTNVGTAPASTVVLATTGQQRNLVSDSDFKFGSTYWDLASGNIVFSVGADGGNAFSAVAPNPVPSGYDPFASSAIPVPLIAGATYTLSVYLDATQATAGGLCAYVFDSNWQQVLGVATQTAGHKGRVSASFTVPAGYSQFYIGLDSSVPSGGTWTNITCNPGDVLIWSNPQLEIGSVATAYKPNVLDDSTGSLAYGAMSTGVRSTINSGGGVNFSATGHTGTIDLGTYISGRTADKMTYTAGGTVDSLRPAQAGADVTSANTAAAIANQGALATKSQADYLGGDIANRPQDPHNMIVKCDFQDSSVGTWGSGTSIGSTSGPYSNPALVTSLRDTYENNWFPVTAGQRYYVAGWCWTGNSTYTASIGLHSQDASGVSEWNTGATLAAGQGYTYISGWMTIPANHIKAQPWLQIDGPGGGQTLNAVCWTQLYIGKYQPGSDITSQNTAANTSNVDSIPSTSVSSTINHGGGVNFSASGHTGSLSIGGGNVFDTAGNLKLKNANQVKGTTTNPSVSSSYADLPELGYNAANGTGNPDMSYTHRGNPVLVGANLLFEAISSGGAVVSCPVDTSTVFTQDQVTGSNIAFSGDGGGAAASISWSQWGVDGNGYPTYVMNSISITNGGSGYTTATATLLLGDNSSEVLGACSVSGSSAVAGVQITVQITQDTISGSTVVSSTVVYGPASVYTDANGLANMSILQMTTQGNGTYAYHVQARYSGSAVPASSVRSFQLVELG